MLQAPEAAPPARRPRRAGGAPRDPRASRGRRPCRGHDDCSVEPNETASFRPCALHHVRGSSEHPGAHVVPDAVLPRLVGCGRHGENAQLVGRKRRLRNRCYCWNDDGGLNDGSTGDLHAPDSTGPSLGGPALVVGQSAHRAVCFPGSTRSLSPAPPVHRWPERSGERIRLRWHRPSPPRDGVGVPD